MYKTEVAAETAELHVDWVVALVSRVDMLAGELRCKAMNKGLQRARGGGQGRARRVGKQQGWGRAGRQGRRPRATGPTQARLLALAASA